MTDYTLFMCNDCQKLQVEYAKMSQYEITCPDCDGRMNPFRDPNLLMAMKDSYLNKLIKELQERED